MYSIDIGVLIADTAVMDNLEQLLLSHAKKERVIKRGAQIAFEWSKSFQQNDEVALYTLFMDVSQALYSCKASYTPEQWPVNRGILNTALEYVQSVETDEALELRDALAYFIL